MSEYTQSSIAFHSDQVVTWGYIVQGGWVTPGYANFFANNGGFALRIHARAGANPNPTAVEFNTHQNQVFTRNSDCEMFCKFKNNTTTGNGTRWFEWFLGFSKTVSQGDNFGIFGQSSAGPNIYARSRVGSATTYSNLLGTGTATIPNANMPSPPYAFCMYLWTNDETREVQHLLTDWGANQHRWWTH